MQENKLVHCHAGEEPFVTHIVKLFSFAKDALRDKGYKAGGNLGRISLEENLRDDFCWTATAHCLTSGDLDTARELLFQGNGLEAHEALLDLIENIKRIPDDTPGE